MTQKQKARAYDAIKLVEKFNQSHKVGDTVMWRSINREGISYQPYITSSEAFVFQNEAVVCFEGKSGNCSIEHGFLLTNLRK